MNFKVKRKHQSMHKIIKLSDRLPVAHVKWEYIIFSESGFKSTNIRKINSLAAMASLCGPVGAKGGNKSDISKKGSEQYFFK